MTADCGGSQFVALTASGRPGGNDSEESALAVGSAKELIESTAKVVLTERGLPVVSDKADLPELVRQVQQALGLHPSSAAPGPDGTEAVKRILGGVSTIAAGLAELRNRGYGPGHGAARGSASGHAVATRSRILDIRSCRIVRAPSRP
ncbi:MAG TPA: abortive infection family protein [Streptosporangiaceae bacterium]|nr:abortive infection family protein [Streptosporangiaceae bacterium]